MIDYINEVSIPYTDYSEHKIVSHPPYTTTLAPYKELYLIVQDIERHDFCASQEQLRRGFELVEEGLALEPRHPGLYIGKGFLQLVAGDTRAARQSFETSYRLNKRFKDLYCQPGDALFGIGSAYLMEGKYAKAKEKLLESEKMGNRRAGKVLKEHLWWLWW